MVCAGCSDCAFDGRALPIDYHEIHITVSACDGEAFVKTCAALDIKAIVVAYTPHEGGSTLTDPMTSQRFRGTQEEALAEADRIWLALDEEGFAPIRTKIETTPNNPVWQEGTGYFESHIGVRLKRERLEALRTAAGALNAHVSNNAFKNHGEEVTQMVTVRADARETTPDRFKHHMLWMNGMFDSMEGLDAEKLIVEYCWHDTNRKHDSQWMGDKV